MKHRNMMNLLITCVLCVALTGCKTDVTPEIPAGSLVNQNGCKRFASETAPKSIPGNPVFPPAEECISYQYDPGRTLYLQHINGGFNCCPGDIIAEITIGDNGITIIEAETSEEKCHCLCLYDLEYEIKNIDPGRYTVYISGSLKQITAEIDLHQAHSGTICVERTEYPWDY